MGVADLRFDDRRSLDEILAELSPEHREILDKALRTRKGTAGTSRFFMRSSVQIAKALADDGYHVTSEEIEQWRRAHGY